MKWLELTAKFTFYTFRNWDDYREGCIEVPDDMPSPPLDWVWNFDLEKFEAPIIPPVTLEQAKASKLIEIANARYAEEISGLTLPDGTIIKTDRESQAQLSSTYTTLLNGILTEVDWKAAGGVWVKVTLIDITPIVSAVALFVQSLFTKEKQKCIEIDACLTKEEVSSIVWKEVINDNPTIP